MSHEIEEQRQGRNKDTQVNLTYINSGAFRRKFDAVGHHAELGRLLYQLAKKILLHRTGTNYEDMYWIDLDTLEVFAAETDSALEKRIFYSNATKKELAKHSNVLTLHSHPDGFPPSIEDFNSNFEHDYVIGIVVGHDGAVYMYSSQEKINERYYKLTVEGYLKRGYNDREAQLLSIAELQKNFQIFFKEVVDDGNIRE